MTAFSDVGATVVAIAVVGALCGLITAFPNLAPK
jgi:flagellar motor component MotA